MSGRTMILLVAIVAVCDLSGGAIRAQQRAKTPPRQLNTSKLDGCMKTARDKATGLKRLVDTLRSSTAKNRSSQLKNIVDKANELVASAETLRKELSTAERVGAQQDRPAPSALGLANLRDLVEDMRRALTAGSVDFTANCDEPGASCLEAACTACCHARFSDPQEIEECRQYCRAQAAMCRALEILRETEEENTQNVRSMTNV